MSSKEFAAQTFKWLYQVNWDADLMPVDVKVAVQLTRHFNEDDGGRAFPGYETIAEGCKADDGREAYTKSIGVSEHTVIRSVRRMSQRGHLRVEWGAPGRGRPNQYWMILKPARVQVSTSRKTCTGAG
jgi:hypothetical protein